MIRLMNLTPETAYEAFAGIARKYASPVSLFLSLSLSLSRSLSASVAVILCLLSSEHLYSPTTCSVCIFPDFWSTVSALADIR